jgi:hypothetical protein
MRGVLGSHTRNRIVNIYRFSQAKAMLYSTVSPVQGCTWRRSELVAGHHLATDEIQRHGAGNGRIFRH